MLIEFWKRIKWKKIIFDLLNEVNMKRIKKKYIVIPSVTIPVVLIGLFIWIVIFNQPIIIKGDGYYMEHINSIEFSDNVRVMKTEVSSSDVYGTHVLAEAIIETDLSREEIREIIDESLHGKNIKVFQLFFKEDGSAESLEWDDYFLDGESIEGETKEGLNYYLLNESTPYGSVFCLWEE